jgi:prevent-host-death family protein
MAGDKFLLDWADFGCLVDTMKTTWPLHNAKNKLSELLDAAMRHGAQTIPRRGKPVAVVVSAEAYARLQPLETLVEVLRDCPVKDWRVDRRKEVARNLRFE